MYRENCGDKLDAFLSRTYYLNGGYNNKEGMAKLNAQMEQFEVSLVSLVIGILTSWLFLNSLNGIR